MSEKHIRPWYADMIEDYAIFIVCAVMVIVFAFTDGRCSLRVVSTPSATQPAKEAASR